mmetsp:Transcript_18084/g.33019  ORF Transcript_18084/g.33019 Transcript_18084/m.33019 type:complete len:548 (-) Transcript_18084:8-1651(-)
MGVEILSGKGTNADLDDTSAFLKILQERSQCEHFDPKMIETKALFNWSEPVHIARAPGRLDVMGGIADYSGSLVLQMPLKEACHCAVQIQNNFDNGRKDPYIRIYSFCESSDTRQPYFEAPLLDLFPSGKPLSYSDACAYFKRNAQTSWAAYVAGCILVLFLEESGSLSAASRAALFNPSRSTVSFVLLSAVPEGKGVSSSAAVEVATMRALVSALDLDLSPERLATLSQMAENFVVGAPCGIMDQMASALGQSSRLLALLCRPAKVLGHVSLPAGVSVWGLDSGVRHSVGGSDYATVRAAAFMGRTMLMEGGECTTGSKTHVTEFRPSDLAVRWSDLPVEMLGSEFLDRFPQGHGDKATTIVAGRTYPIRAAVRHPVDEHSRIETFQELLELRSLQQAAAANASCSSSLPTANGKPTYKVTQESVVPYRESYLTVLGEMMMQSHESYSACGLGCSATDRIVKLVKELGYSVDGRRCLFGAKISGGGNGGTVVILGDGSTEASEAVQRVREAFDKERKSVSDNVKPSVLFQGTSMGAMEFGALVARF